MGVLNVTPDSFSDGGTHLDPDVAAAAARRMIEDGAAIVDIGGESTRPGSDGVSVEEELARVVPVFERLGGDVPLSIDTTKAAVAGLTRAMALDHAAEGIRVNAVAPGFIATEMVTAMPEKVLQGMVAHTPLGRMGKPEDIAEAYFWLASDAAGFVHGTVLSVDGGLVGGT